MAKKFMYVCAGVLILSGSVMAVPVDPNAPDGIAAYYAEDMQFTVLTTDGIMLAPGAANTWEPLAFGLPDGVSVFDIADWFGRYWLITHDGTVWRATGQSTEYWENIGMLPTSPVSESVASMGDVKSLFR